MGYDEVAAAVSAAVDGVVAAVVVAAAVVVDFAVFADETFVVADVAAFHYFYLNY